MRIFRRYCSYRFQLHFLHRNAVFRDRGSRLCNGWDFNPSRICISCRDKKKESDPGGKRSLVFHDDETSGRVRFQRGEKRACIPAETAALHYANRINWRGTGWYCQVLKHQVSKYARRDFDLRLEINFRRTLFRSDVIPGYMVTCSLVFSQVYRIQLILIIAASCFHLASFP